MNQNRTQQNLLLLFLLLSLLVHLLVVFLSRDLDLFPRPEKEQRVYVQMRQPEQFRDLDIPVRPELEKPRDKPAKRLGPADQVVEKEQAPKGDSPEDMRPDAAAPPAPKVKPTVVPPPPAKVEAKQERQPDSKKAPAERQAEKAEVSRQEQREPTEPSEQAEPLPDLKSLLQLPQSATARIDKEWRQKQRDDVAIGDEVWLDSQHDLLFSFFQRLRTNIYNVWNYPASAVSQGREGRSLLSMTFSRDGKLQEIKLLRSSGTHILDREAMAAVRKGSPYGPLPRSYPNDKLTIKAWFTYDLRRSQTKGAGIYGQ